MTERETYTVTEDVNSFDHSIITRSARSKKDGSYIGTIEFADMLERKGIQPEALPGNKVASIGFCEREQKWYGWSHRAIFGFAVGHTVKKGDINYIASSPEELIEDRGDFFRDISDECAAQKMAECQVLPDRSGIRILHTPIRVPMLKDISDLADAVAGEDVDTVETVLFEDAVSIQKCGKGEWTAQTLDDAKQMAIDFAEAVG